MITQIFDYLEELSDDQINELYGCNIIQNNSLSSCSFSQSQWVCRAVFQSLNEINKYIIMRLLFLNSSIYHSELLIWYNGNNEEDFNLIINELLKSRILTLVRNHQVDCLENSQNSKENREYIMNKGFKESMKYNISGIYEPWTEIKDDLVLIVGKNVPTESQLREECIKKWNYILQFMITSDSSLNISQTVINYLLGAGLMQHIPIESDHDPNHLSSSFSSSSSSSLNIRINNGIIQQPATRLCITSKGYEYLLLDIQTQVGFVCLIVIYLLTNLLTIIIY